MADWIPESHQDLLADETRAFAFLATTMSDGSPQVTPVWFDVQDGLVRVNTSRGNVKDRNMTARPKVALAIPDPKNPYRYVQIRGTVVAVTEEGAREHIDRLSAIYTGQAPFQGPRRHARVTYVIRPDSISTQG